MFTDVARAIVPLGMTFAIGIAITPMVAHYLYKYKTWKKTPGKMALDGSTASEFNRLHSVQEVRAPRMGGIVIWASVLITVVLSSLLAYSFGSFYASLEFLSRNQTWLPLATLVVGAFVGFIDDYLVIQPEAEGIRLRYRLFVVVLLSFFIGYWFYDKLDIHSVGIPFHGSLEIGWLVVPLFMLISLALYASGVIDGIDGLSGGVFASVFASYAVIAFTQDQIDLAALCASIVGGLLAFLWFNVPPARFYMSDTGTMALTLTIPVIAFLTDDLGEGIGVSVLPIIGMLLLATVASDILQIGSKRIFGKKLFRIAPLHHHFEAIGWPGEKVVMRYWILSIVFAFLGVVVAIIGR